MLGLGAKLVPEAAEAVEREDGAAVNRVRKIRPYLYVFYFFFSS
jgi:hypothetical protein